MQIVDNLIILCLIILSFVSGITLANKYNRQAQYEKKDALERQFLRLKANADADDPCKPYIAPIPIRKYSGDFDGDPIGQPFMDQLKKTGRATTKLPNKSDIAK